MVTPISAASAYARLARMTDPGSGLAGAGGATGDAASGSFGSMVKEALGAVVEAGNKADTQVKSLASGRTNMVDLVTAVAESETAITTLVSVRDRVIQAYQQIMQMPI
jgi:flagellar hook-basal body complex protein FliE